MKSVDNILGYIQEQFTGFREAVSLGKIFEIVQENTLKCSKLTHFRQQKIEFRPECLG